MDDLKTLITNDITAENADSEKYIKLAEIAEENYPDQGYGFILRCISREEEQHKKLLTEILNDIQKGSDD